MLKNLWNAVGFLAIVHLLTFGVFVGWLAWTGRLDVDRIERMRSMLAMTIEDEAAERAAAEEAAEAEWEAAATAARRERPGPPSAEQIAYANRQDQQFLETIRRSETDIDHLREQLVTQQRAIGQQRDQLAAERAAFEAEREWFNTLQEDEQFARVVALLERVPPAQAKAMIIGWMNDGDVESAVSYLNAMNLAASRKVLREFRGDDELRLAANLLERLRTYGTAPEAAGRTNGAQDELNGLPADPNAR